MYTRILYWFRNFWSQATLVLTQSACPSMAKRKLAHVPGQGTLSFRRCITLASGQVVEVARPRLAESASSPHVCQLCDLSFKTIHGLRGRQMSKEHKQRVDRSKSSGLSGGALGAELVPMKDFRCRHDSTSVVIQQVVIQQEL